MVNLAELESPKGKLRLGPLAGGRARLDKITAAVEVVFFA
jgi:hypothetical protein